MRFTAVLAASALAIAASAVASGPRDEIVFVGPHNGVQTNVLAIHPDGSHLRLVAANASNPRWLPDGTQIVFTTFQIEAHGGFTPKGLVTVAGQGGAPRQITSGADNAIGWSPNGRWIAFVRSETRKTNLYVVHPDGSGVRRLRESKNSDGWTPDSKRLVISQGQGLATVDLTGRVRAIPNASCAGEGAYSPNGRWFAFSRCLGRPYHTGIAVERADGTGLRWLAKPISAAGNWQPVWSPDGTKLAYVEERPVDYLEHTEIRMVSLAGKRLGNLDSYAQDHDEYPQWSPDGKQIVFDRDAAVEPIGESDRLYVGDVRSGRVRKLYDNIWRGNQFWRPR